MKKLKLIFIMLISLMVLINGCINVEIKLEPKHNMNYNMNFIAISEDPIVKGMIDAGLSDIMTENTVCEKIDNGISCTRSNVYYQDDKGIGKNSPYENLEYVKTNGILKNTYRIQFKSTNIIKDFYKQPSGNIILENASIEMIIKPFGSIKETNCLRYAKEDLVFCDLLREEEYYVEWSDWFFMNWFSFLWE